MNSRPLQQEPTIRPHIEFLFALRAGRSYFRQVPSLALWRHTVSSGVRPRGPPTLVLATRCGRDPKRSGIPPGRQSAGSVRRSEVAAFFRIRRSEIGLSCTMPFSSRASWLSRWPPSMRTRILKPPLGKGTAGSLQRPSRSLRAFPDRPRHRRGCCISVEVAGTVSPGPVPARPR